MFEILSNKKKEYRVIQKPMGTHPYRVQQLCRRFFKKVWCDVDLPIDEHISTPMAYDTLREAITAAELLQHTTSPQPAKVLWSSTSPQYSRAVPDFIPASADNLKEFLMAQDVEKHVFRAVVKTYIDKGRFTKNMYDLVLEILSKSESRAIKKDSNETPS